MLAASRSTWALMTNQLNHERVALTSSAPLVHAVAEVRRWAQETKNPDGSRVIDAEWVQVLLGRALGEDGVHVQAAGRRGDCQTASAVRHGASIGA